MPPIQKHQVAELIGLSIKKRLSDVPKLRYGTESTDLRALDESGIEDIMLMWADEVTDELAGLLCRCASADSPIRSCPFCA